MNRAMLDGAITLISTGRTHMARTVLVQLAEAIAPPATDLHSARQVRELHSSLMAAHEEIEALRRQLIAAEVDLSHARREVARMKRGRHQPQEKKHARLARLIDTGVVSAAEVAAILKCDEAAVTAIAAGRLTLATSAWRKLWRALSDRGVPA